MNCFRNAVFEAMAERPEYSQSDCYAVYRSIPPLADEETVKEVAKYLNWRLIEHGTLVANPDKAYVIGYSCFTYIPPRVGVLLLGDHPERRALEFVSVDAGSKANAHVEYASIADYANYPIRFIMDPDRPFTKE